MEKKTSIYHRTLAFAYVLLVAVIFCGCSRGERGAMVIVTKSYETFMGNPMPKGLCRYYYREWSGPAEAQEFTDSCGRYNIGDTIHLTSVVYIFNQSKTNEKHTLITNR